MKILELTGKADDLFSVDNNGMNECVSVAKADGEECGDYIMTFTSLTKEHCEGKCSHELVKSLLGHNIKFTLETID